VASGRWPGKAAARKRFNASGLGLGWPAGLVAGDDPKQNA